MIEIMEDRLATSSTPAVALTGRPLSEYKAIKNYLSVTIRRKRFPSLPLLSLENKIAKENYVNFLPKEKGKLFKIVFKHVF
jgi:hypothetical protein